MSWICYTLISTNNKYCNRTYTGVTNNSTRRLRAHNGELVGGARTTKILRPVKYFIKIHNLTKSRALSIEKTIHNLKHNKNRKYTGIVGSILALGYLMERKLITYSDIEYIGFK